MSAQVTFLGCRHTFCLQWHDVAAPIAHVYRAWLAYNTYRWH